MNGFKDVAVALILFGLASTETAFAGEDVPPAANTPQQAYAVCCGYYNTLSFATPALVSDLTEQKSQAGCIFDAQTDPS